MLSRICALLFLVSLGANAFSIPPFLKVFEKTYAGMPGVENGCRNCHTRPPVRNDFGKAVAAKLGPQGVTEQILRGLENEDSDHDGWTNLDEIKAGTLPGDASSHPSGTPPSKPVSAPVPSADKPTAPLIPEHTFHPVLVHFPIALFLFGVFAEVLGKVRKSDELGKVAGWNLAFGFLGALASILTGFIAAYRMGRGFPPTGDANTHMLFALGGTVLMAATLWARKRGGAAYWVLLALAAIVIGYAGHLGGQMVFG